MNYECQACDHQAYAHKGGKSERKWLASIDDPAAAPEPAPAPAPEPAAKQKRTASVFSLGEL